MRVIYRMFLLVLLAIVPVVGAHGQSDDNPDPGQMALNVNNSVKANSKNVARYTWKNTLEINSDGKMVSKTVNQVKISDGKPATTLISQEPQEEDEKRLRGKKQDKKKAYFQSVLKLANSYTNVSVGDLVEFFEAATFALGTGNMDGFVQVQGKGLVQEGDEVTMWIDNTTFQPHMTNYHTKLDGDLMTGTVTYDYVSDGGPFYVAKHVIAIDDKKLETTIANSDYEVAE